MRTDEKAPAFVAIMSQGASGDQMWPDYSKPAPTSDLDGYTEAIAQEVYAAYRRIQYHDWVPLKMAQADLPVPEQVVNDAQYKWAQGVLAAAPATDSGLAGSTADNQLPAVAIRRARAMRELREHPAKKVIQLQALRIGDLGMIAIPSEVFAITGLKIKAQSPLRPIVDMEISNGYEGYLPPPEQFAFGGWTTWPVTGYAGLEPQAEPKIVAAVLGLLEQVSGKPRHPVVNGNGAYANAVLRSQPKAYWRLEEFSGTEAKDATGHGNSAHYEGGVAFYLPGRRPTPSPGCTASIVRLFWPTGG